MDLLRNLESIIGVFSTIKTSLEFLESYLSVNYVEMEKEILAVITQTKENNDSVLTATKNQMERCQQGYESLSETELYKCLDIARIGARVLYHLNNAIFNEVMVGGSVIKIFVSTEDVEDEDCCVNENITAVEKFLSMTLDERMEILGVDDYTTMCKDYEEYVTHEEFEELLSRGEIRSVDNIIEFKGLYYDNEFSEESLDRDEGFRKHFNRSNTENIHNHYKEEFPHDYFLEQLSDFEDMEYYGSDMSTEEVSEAYNDILDEYADALEEYNNNR